jgi:2'-5' RNA ligase
MKVLKFTDFIDKASLVNSIKSDQKTDSDDKKEKPVYDYGCMMVYFNFPEMEDIHSKIDTNDLFEDGQKSLETDPHVTLLYGLHADEIDDKDVMNAVDKSIIKNLKLCNISAFKNDERDVLKFDVKGDGLSENNENLKKFPFTSDYPDYHPHATIAYLKPGTSDKYIEMFKDREFEITPFELVYSKPGKDSEKNKLKEKFNDNSK